MTGEDPPLLRGDCALPSSTPSRWAPLPARRPLSLARSRSSPTTVTKPFWYFPPLILAIKLFLALKLSLSAPRIRCHDITNVTRAALYRCERKKNTDCPVGERSRSPPRPRSTHFQNHFGPTSDTHVKAANDGEITSRSAFCRPSLTPS